MLLAVSTRRNSHPSRQFHQKQQPTCTIVQKQGTTRHPSPCTKCHCRRHKCMPSSTTKTTHLEPGSIWLQLKDGPRLGNRSLDKTGPGDIPISIHSLILIILLGLLANIPSCKEGRRGAGRRCYETPSAPELAVGQTAISSLSVASVNVLSSTSWLMCIICGTQLPSLLASRR